MLTKSTEYALRALVFIQLKNWEGNRPGIIEISSEIESPSAFTAKILQTLTRHGLLRSAKGRGGGFFFDAGRGDLSLFDVVKVMEGESFFSSCGFGLKNCSDEQPCPLHKSYAKIRDGYAEIIRSETVQSLAMKVKKGKAVLNRISHDNTFNINKS
ncbi:MAG TPA: Rrf2 family transcriptional regulator [Bacteroidales bacterium]|nr:Rrf2 family transcriptional regulator [Bacteroidales bacterium]